MNEIGQRIIYANLTEFLLGEFRKRPGMYLGEAKMTLLSTFILGCRVGFDIAKDHPDEYFGENGFLDWFCSKYNIQQTSFWCTPFLDEANGDETEALKVFFRYLEEYNEDKKMKS